MALPPGYTLLRCAHGETPSLTKFLRCGRAIDLNRLLIRLRTSPVTDKQSVHSTSWVRTKHQTMVQNACLFSVHGPSWIRTRYETTIRKRVAGRVYGYELHVFEDVLNQKRCPEPEQVKTPTIQAQTPKYKSRHLK